MTPANGIDPKNYVISTSASYVTGSHNFKAGFQWGFGSYVLDTTSTATSSSAIATACPTEVRVYNTPVRSEEFLNGDFGIYAQDSWTLDRLTLNAGLRAERFKGRSRIRRSAPGRFAPARNFDKMPCMPCWLDLAPRFGVSYDLFGNARTALKGDDQQVHGGPDAELRAALQPAGARSPTRGPGAT